VPALLDDSVCPVEREHFKTGLRGEPKDTKHHQQDRKPFRKMSFHVV
jgi:hypothetical protein